MFSEFQYFLVHVLCRPRSIGTLPVGVKFRQEDITHFPTVLFDDGAAGVCFIQDDFVADETDHFDGTVGFAEGDLYFSSLLAPNEFHGVFDFIAAHINGFIRALSHFYDLISHGEFTGFPCRHPGHQCGDPYRTVFFTQGGTNTIEATAHLLVEGSLLDGREESGVGVHGFGNSVHQEIESFFFGESDIPALETAFHDGLDPGASFLFELGVCLHHKILLSLVGIPLIEQIGVTIQAHVFQPLAP